MTNKEIAEELRSHPKRWQGIMSAIRYSEKVKAIEHGLCKPSTAIAFLALFGYTGEWENWHKIEKAA